MQNGINSVMFSPDNRWVLTASDDHTVKCHWVEQLPSLSELVAAAGERVYGAAASETIDATRGA